MFLAVLMAVSVNDFGAFSVAAKAADTATVKGVTYTDPEQKTVEGDYGAHSMSYAAAAYTGYEQKTASSAGITIFLLRI